MTPVRQADAPIPVTGLTGYLGAAKPILLDRLITENRGADSFIHEECLRDR